MDTKANIAQPTEYLGYWGDVYKNDFLNDVMPFWLKYGIDKENGGYFTCLNRDGSLMDSNKSVWFQGRFAFILAYAYNHIEKIPNGWRHVKTALTSSKNTVLMKTDVCFMK